MPTCAGTGYPRTRVYYSRVLYRDNVLSPSVTIPSIIHNTELSVNVRTVALGTAFAGLLL